VTALSFRLACVPPTAGHHHKKIIRLRTRTGNEFLKLGNRPELNQAMRLLEELLIPHQPPAPVIGPVVLTVEYTWPWLASHGKKVRALGRIPHISKPDLTNVTKTLEDRLCELLFIEDDRKVVDLHARKWWGDEPGIAITIAPFGSTSIASTLPPHWQADALPLLTTRGELL
jgi:Holliday junction resolvase RusA-like endonuclease